jgi:hypothetical protein
LASNFVRFVGNKAAAHLTFKPTSLTLWTSPAPTEVLQAELIVHLSTTLQLASATWCQPVVAAAEVIHRLQFPRLVFISSISVIGCAFVDLHKPGRSPSSANVWTGPLAEKVGLDRGGVR